MKPSNQPPPAEVGDHVEVFTDFGVVVAVTHWGKKIFYRSHEDGETRIVERRWATVVPSPEHMRAAREAIQAGWSANERLVRQHYKVARCEVTEVTFVSGDNFAQEVAH